MDIKARSKDARDGIQHGIYRVINPFVRLLIKMGVTPNMVTTIGFLGNVVAAAVLVYVGLEQGSHPNYALVTLSGALIIGFSLFDMLDGQVARLGNMVSRFGAMYDSVLDRYCEFFNLGSVAFYMLAVGCPIGALITFLALVGSLMVSYVRARAEGLGIECKMGLMQRPERVVITSVAILATGITGMCSKTIDANVILLVAMCVIAVFANVTAFARLNHCRKSLS